MKTTTEITPRPKPQLPSLDMLKTQAKRLRQEMGSLQNPMTHSAALEAIAKQWGFRDWNTLSATARSNAPKGWHVGQRVRGLYLGHSFEGQVKAVSRANSGYWSVTVVFDTAIDVVESTQFSAYRRQVNVVLTPEGQTPARLSNGTAHMYLQDASDLAGDFATL